MKNESACRVKVDRELEPEIEKMGPRELREVAKKFRNWAHQLEFKALITEIDAMPKPASKKIKWLPGYKLVRN